MISTATPATKAFVVGWPISHSRSPLVHNYWLKKLGINGSYQAVAIEPERIESFLNGLGKDNEFVGGNVTIPHKEATYLCCSHHTDQARRLKAVNTIWLQDGELHGDNSDGHGFVANMDDQAPNWDKADRIAVIFGAGGAARAILLALEGRGFKTIRIINRTPVRATRMVSELGVSAEIFPADKLQAAISGAGIFINTTSLGMTGQPPLEIDLSVLAPDAIVSDIVYSPLETRLLASARKSGFTPVDGLGMLLHQAVPGFERWFGQRPIVSKALRELVVQDLGAKKC